MKAVAPMERCGARLKSRKGTCRHELGWGTQHVGVGRCKLHGGAEPHAQVNGMVLLARREQAVMGMPLAIEPQDAILECIRICAGEVFYASQRIEALQAEDAVGPVMSRTVRRAAIVEAGDVDVEPQSAGKAQIDAAKHQMDTGKHQPGDDVAAREQLLEEVRYGPPAVHIWIQARHEAMDRLTQFSVAALRAGVQERLVSIAEGQAQLLAEAIRGILTDLGVHDDPEAPAIVRRHLTLLSRGAGT